MYSRSIQKIFHKVQLRDPQEPKRHAKYALTRNVTRGKAATIHNFCQALAGRVEWLISHPFDFHLMHLPCQMAVAKEKWADFREFPEH